jgi:hypothetical protein
MLPTPKSAEHIPARLVCVCCVCRVSCVCVWLTCVRVCVCVCVMRARNAYRYNNGWIVVGRSIDLGHNNVGVLGEVLTHLLPRGRHLLAVATPYDQHTHTHTHTVIFLLAHAQRLAKETYRERRIR